MEWMFPLWIPAIQELFSFLGIGTKQHLPDFIKHMQIFASRTNLESDPRFAKVWWVGWTAILNQAAPAVTPLKIDLHIFSRLLMPLLLWPLQSPKQGIFCKVIDNIIFCHFVKQSRKKLLLTPDSFISTKSSISDNLYPTTKIIREVNKWSYIWHRKVPKRLLLLLWDIRLWWGFLSRC